MFGVLVIVVVIVFCFCFFFVKTCIIGNHFNQYFKRVNISMDTLNYIFVICLLILFFFLNVLDMRHDLLMTKQNYSLPGIWFAYETKKSALKKSLTLVCYFRLFLRKFFMSLVIVLVLEVGRKLFYRSWVKIISSEVERNVKQFHA